MLLVAKLTMTPDSDTPIKSMLSCCGFHGMHRSQIRSGLACTGASTAGKGKPRKLVRNVCKTGSGKCSNPITLKLTCPKLSRKN